MTDVTDDEDETDPGRFAADPSDIKMLGKPRIVDHLTDEERAQNAEHDRIVKESLRDMHEK